MSKPHGSAKDASPAGATGASPAGDTGASPAGGKRWVERISTANLVVTLVGGILGVALAGFALGHLVFPAHPQPSPRAQLTAKINKVTVQPGVTFKDYKSSHQPGNFDPNMPSPNATVGILVQIQAKLSGYINHIYSANLTLLNPKTHTALPLRNALQTCSEAAPSAVTYSFVLNCWIAEPRAGQKFLVVSQLEYSGLKARNYRSRPLHYFSVNPQTVAILEVGPFRTPK